MREDIKERIEIIHKGKLPEGYKKTKKGIVPKTWEVTKLGKNVNVFRGASPRPKGDPRYYDGSIPRVLIEDLTRDGKVVYPCIDSLTEEGAKKSRFLEKGSIIMSCSGTRVGITGFLGVDACIHDGFFGFNGFKNLNKDFLYYVLIYETELLQSSATKGGVFNNLTTDIMKKLQILLPPLNEQIGIEIILKTIDKNIEQHQYLIKEKNRQKKWLLNILLNGKIRTNDFCGKWKKVKLKDISEFQSSNIAVPNIVEEDGEYPIYDARKVVGLISYYEQEEKYISIVKDGAGVGRLNICDAKSSVISTMGYILPNKEIDFYFLYYCLVKINFAKYKKGSTIPHIYYKDYCKENILLPPLEEQKYIAKILSQADKEIELIQQKLEQIKLEKKAMMQLLLTGIVRVDQKGDE